MGALADFDEAEWDRMGERLYAFAADLFPICRSITGDGVRRTLAGIGARIPVEITEIPSGTQVFDWTVPREWNVRDAYIQGPRKERIADFQRSNLHLVSYSVPTRTTLPLSELRGHLFTIPDRPDWIPYRTSYYRDDWGFCLPHKEMAALTEGDYEVTIDSTLEDGHLTYGECYLRGRLSEEVLISAHVCHPSLANDNLSGIAVATFLAEVLAGRDLRYSYRFFFGPGTIGAISWLARNQQRAHLIQHGFVLAGVGDAGALHYKRSRRGNAMIDRVAAHILKHSREPFEILDFSPAGYDERQFCSPGFNLPVGCLMRSVWGTFPEYHTSADNLKFISPGQLARTLRVCLGIVDVLEGDGLWWNQNPFCEPQLGKRTLYGPAGDAMKERQTAARLWVLNFSDGKHTLLDIAERSGLPFAEIRAAADTLHTAGLLTEDSVLRAGSH